MLSDSAMIVASDDVLAGEFDSEAVMLDLRSGVYYGLEGTGARIWRLLASPISLAALRDALVAEYDVEPARCEADLRELIADLARRGLVHLSDASDGGDVA